MGFNSQRFLLMILVINFMIALSIVIHQNTTTYEESLINGTINASEHFQYRWDNQPTPTNPSEQHDQEQSIFSRFYSSQTLWDTLKNMVNPWAIPQQNNPIGQQLRTIVQIFRWLFIVLFVFQMYQWIINKST